MRLAQRINEAEKVFLGIRVYEAILDFLITFLIFSIVLQIVRISIVFAVVPTIITTLLVLSRKFKESDVVSVIEEKNANLRERLKTAKDNINEDNLIVKDLKSDVSALLNDLETSSFIEPKTFASRVVMVIVLMFVLLTFTAFDLMDLGSDLLRSSRLLDSMTSLMDEGRLNIDSSKDGNSWESSDEIYKLKEPEKLGAEPGGEKPGYSEGPIPGRGWGAGGEENPNIFGDASAANLYGKDVNFKLHPEYGGDIEIHDTAEAKDKVDFTLDSVRSAETCDECVIGPEYEEIVRKYFEKVVGET